MKLSVLKIFFLLGGLCTLAGSPVSGKADSSAGRWVIWSDKPAFSWEHAFVTGNGQQGTMVMGSPVNERIICVHEELFIRGWNPAEVTVPLTAPLMPEVRKLMDAGKSDAASHLLTDEADRQLSRMGACQRWPLIPHPAFDLRIRWHDLKAGEKTTDYRRRLNLETGETTVCWQNSGLRIEESVFSSREHHANVIRLKSNSARKLCVTLSLEETPGRKGVHFEHNLDSAFTEVMRSAEPGWLMYRAGYTKTPGGYEGVGRVTLKGGRMIAADGYIKIEDAEEILVVVRITPLSDKKLSSIKPVKAELSRLSGNYDALLKPHSRKHGEMFRRMRMDLGCAAEWKDTPIEKMLDDIRQQGVTPLFLEQVQAMGRYLLISSSGKYPPPLQGIWGGGWTPAWIGGFVWDSNINLAVSAASISNLAECAETYNNHVIDLLPGWRANARNYLGYRGFIVAHYNDPTNGYLTHFGSSFPWMLWAGGAGWNIRPLYEYAMLTGNRDFLKKQVLPLYMEMADFYEDFLTLGSDGLYHICPSISPENTPAGTDTWLSRDATMDVAIAREVFGLLCNMGKQVGLSPKQIEKWSFYLHKLPDYRINEDGALAEWVDESYPDIYNHRHNSHLYPVFPGVELVGTDADQRLQQAACTALDKRFAFDTSSAHGLIHLALQAARLKETDKVYRNLDRFSRRDYLYTSLVTSHEPGNRIYNLDAVLSFPRLLIEMLVFTRPGHIALMPAWPESYPDGSVKGIRIYGGHTLDMNWKNGKVENLTIYAKINETLEWSYRGETKHIQLKKNQVYRWNSR